MDLDAWSNKSNLVCKTCTFVNLLTHLSFRVIKFKNSTEYEKRYSLNVGALY